MDEYQYSARLKEAMAEIKAVLRRYDIASYVVLSEPGCSEYLFDLEPSWSAMQLVKGADNAVVGMRVRAKRAEFDSAEAQHRRIEDTLNLLTHLSDLLGEHRQAFAQLRARIEEKVDAEHSEGVHTPHREH